MIEPKTISSTARNVQPSVEAFEGLVNVTRLKQAEDAFLTRFPGGFANPELMAIRNKRHNVKKMIAFAQEKFAKRHFQLPDEIVKHMIAVVSRSSVISMFEKPKFRDAVSDFAMEEKRFLADGLEELLHGNEQWGFEAILDLLKKQAVERLAASGFNVDYVEIADAETLQIAGQWDGKQKLVALAAAFLNGVRLIDNILLS